MEDTNEELLKITADKIEIRPQTKYLSANELTTYRNNVIPTLAIGLKRTEVENTAEEQNELAKLYDQLQSQLSRHRIERFAGRALGVWDFGKNLVRVERKDGKFGNFGFTIEGQLYLEFYEALFLLEVNRLQLEYNSTVVSIEQAYLLLLGEQHSTKYHEYLVYSNLTREGYIVVKYQNKHFATQQINNEADCVWAVLEAELRDGTVDDHVKKTPYYAEVKPKFDKVKDLIKNPTELVDVESKKENDLKCSEKIKTTLKRKAPKESQNKWLTAKRHFNYGHKVLQRSLVDFLKEYDGYKQFKEMFEKFDVVPLKSNYKRQQNEMEHENGSEGESEIDEEEVDENVSKFHISFDVYLHNEGFRKSSPHLPRFRVIILQPQQMFPSHSEIFLAHRQQLHPVPLLIVSVNDSKQMQAFLYYFS